MENKLTKSQIKELAQAFVDFFKENPNFQFTPFEIQTYEIIRGDRVNYDRDVLSDLSKK